MFGSKDKKHNHDHCKHKDLIHCSECDVVSCQHCDKQWEPIEDDGKKGWKPSPPTKLLEFILTPLKMEKKTITDAFGNQYPIGNWGTGNT